MGSVSYMRENGFYKTVYDCGVVPVVVLDRVEDAVPLAHALEEGGLPAAEVTFRTPVAAECIRRIAQECPDVLVGAGTVLNLEQAKHAVDAGARYLVSPGTDEETVLWALANEVNVIPAGVTPTEIGWLATQGVELTKFFPAALSGGVEAIKALASVFVSHLFMPTGGVSSRNLSEYLSVPPVVAVGGTWMVKPQLFADGDFSRVVSLSREVAHSVRAIRSS